VLEEGAPTHAHALHRAVVDGVDTLANRRVEIGEGEKGAMP
jgi:hypothetical protein